MLSVLLMSSFGYLTSMLFELGLMPRFSPFLEVAYKVTGTSMDAAKL